MKTLHLPILISAFLTIFLPEGCDKADGSMDTDQYIINVLGVPVVLNCSKSYTYAGYYTSEENDTVTLAVSAGDLIYFQLMDDDILCYRYNPADGTSLSVSYDTSLARYYLNEELISVGLSDRSAAWEWLATADRKELAGIRSLHLSLPLPEDKMNALKKASVFFTHPGLFVEGDSLLEEWISVISPVWLIAEDLDFTSTPDHMKAGLKHLELLWHTGGDPIDHDLLYDMPALQSLIIEYWDSTGIAGLQWERLKGLRSISIIASEIHDLYPLAVLSGIRNLNFINCESLREISAIAELRSLTCLEFTGCKHITDIPAMLRLPSLTRLSIPGNTTQEEFADIISRQDALQVLELIDCDSITDLSPLVESPTLKALTVDFELSDPAQLKRISGLELLVLGEDFFEDSLAIAGIRQAMPDTRIVAGGGFCLGSGWILLLLPGIILWILVRQLFSGTHHIGSGL
jgi:hypothetical protein